jgi:hypothetical protein
MHGLNALAFLAAAGFALSASAAYTVVSRFSEVRYVNWNDLEGTTTSVLASTTALDPFSFSTTTPALGMQESALSSGGATYTGKTSASGRRGPPAGSNNFGEYTRSQFEIVFTVSSIANYTLTGSLQRVFNATSVLRLEPLTPGGSSTRTASAAGVWDNDWAPTLVNWTGTLQTGTYKLSIVDVGQTLRAGEANQGTTSSFNFVIPSPSSVLVIAVASLLLTHRRRRV